MKIAMTVADLFIIPTNPSQFDLAGLEMIVPIVLECRVFNPGLETMTVINRAHPNPNASEIKDTKVFVSEIKYVTLFETIIRDRIIFRKVAKRKSVVEVRPIDPRAISEIDLCIRRFFIVANFTHPQVVVPTVVDSSVDLETFVNRHDAPTSLSEAFGRARRALAAATGIDEVKGIRDPRDPKITRKAS